MAINKYVGLWLLSVAGCFSTFNVCSAANNVDEQKNIWLTNYVNESEFIFDGTLKKISYQNSAEGIPHTFAQYAVNEIIKGQYYSDTITLRFVGGYFDNDTREKHLTVSNSPVLELNENAILLVRENGTADCPLVACERGRFRIVDGSVVTAADTAITIDDKKNLVYLSRSTRKTSVDKTRSAEKFSQHLRGLVQKSVSKTQSQNLVGQQSVRSVDIYAPFNASKALVTAGVGAPDENANEQKSLHSMQAQIGSDFDHWEEQQLKQNAGNPVLTEKYPY